ncbi:MAG: sigma-70 family RNA polymerase sigma factor [Ardenticatenaceae bacterium]|nr:sigma-70 family RNA polymerase sigma factor [Anaerolineales bacterium]MCB8921361.1 sigma-70 family RNA polymerase sigma factor [Ardenticatenaceae bacterium]MCB9004015.1 sigma-70 family RNA polymerase sigma factor [Ardenticatenaceae bacterium]
MISSQIVGTTEPPPYQHDDIVLVRRAQKDLTSFSELYQRYAQQVYRYLLVRVGNVDDAQDLTSQTFLVAMESLHKFRGDGHFAAWLLGIARHKTVDQYRRRKPETALETAVSLPHTDDTPDVVIDRQLEIERVARKLQTIAPDRAEALSLRLFAGLEVSEIARLMEKNEAAVRMLVFRGLRDLQAQLNGLREERA